MGAHVVADAGHDVAKVGQVGGGQGVDEQAANDLDVAGEDAADEGPAAGGDGDQGGALVIGVGTAGDEAGFFQQSGLVGETAAAVDDAIRELRHGQLAVGTGEAGEELELHVADIALGPELLLNLVLEQADGFHEHEVGAQLLGIERLDAIGTGVGVGIGGDHASIIQASHPKHDVACPALWWLCFDVEA